MPRIVTRTAAIQKLAIDNDIKPTAHAIAMAADVTYEIMRKTLNNDAPPSDKTMASLMALFRNASWYDLFALTDDDALAG